MLPAATSMMRSPCGKCARRARPHGRTPKSCGRFAARQPSVNRSSPAWTVLQASLGVVFYCPRHRFRIAGEASMQMVEGFAFFPLTFDQRGELESRDELGAMIERA